MATVVSKTLQLEKSNVEQYCSANGLSLNAGGYAIRKWLNGSTSGYATLNDAAKNVLYPTATAHPFKIDSEIRGSRSAGSMTVNLEFGGTVVHSQSFTSTSLSTKTSTNITSSAVTSSTRNTQIRWNVKGKNGDNQRVAHVKLVLYFNQYTMSANKGTGANGIQSVSVSNSSPYQGDTVTFTPKLVNGATWDGWYSDAACTQLVSTEQNYSVSPSSDITLYAKATIDAIVYNCIAVAGENIASATVNNDSVVAGENVTFTANPSGHCTFDGWFSDSNYATLVSTANPYTATITSDTTLYAKGTKISYSVRVGTAEHGTATVSANTAHYGDHVTFTFTPEDNTWELYGWYSDEGLTQLVSENNPYTYSVTENVTLYPKVGRIKYKITFKTIAPANHIDMKVAVLDFDALTRTERSYLKVGNYEAIEPSKVFDIKSASISSPIIGKILTVEILCPLGMTAAFWGTDTRTDGVHICYIDDANNNALTSWPYYWYQPSEEATFKLDEGGEPCNCSAIAKEGVSYADATTPTRQGYDAIFEAEVASDYIFSGWYSDEACTMLVSTDNPAYITTPTYTTESASATSLTLYAKAIAPTVIYTVQVGSQPEDGNANVSASTATYGDVVTFTANIAGANREFYGWYKDAAHTQLVSPNATYVATITSDTTLYPLIGKTRYTKIIHPVKLFDALPYRGLVNGANPSQSIPADVSKITNIGLDQATSTVFAYQPHSTAIDFTHGMSIWFGANPIPEMPDNATIIGIQAKFGYSLGDGDYSSVKIGFGRFEYVSDNDETPITGSKSYAYTSEDDETLPEDEVLLQSYLNTNYLVNRASNFSNPMLNANTTYDLIIEPGTSVIQATVTVPINNPEEYPTSVANLKAGKLGFQINCKNKSTNASNRMLRLHAFDLYITYTIEDVSYKCDAISDGYTDVVIQSRDVAPGVENTWIARSIGGYRFDGWYSDPERTNLVSTQQEYVTTITAPLTLYAKSHYHSRVITRVLDIPMGKGNTYFIGMDTNNNILSSETSGSGWKADFKASDYGWLSSIGGISDVVAAACMTNKSSTPYTIKAVLNTAAKDILFPNNTAHMVRLDSNAELGRAAISARLLSGRFKDPVNGNDYITPCFDGICGSVWRPNMIHNVNMVHTNIRHNWVLNVTKQSEIGYLMHQSSSSEWRAEGINNITLTGYFEEYDYAADITTNSRGVQSVNVNQAIGYEGDTIIFTADVDSYATFDGWYSDEAGTQLVSTELNYSSVPDANLTLYAKASAPDGEIYTCQAVAKDNVATASVSEPDILAGNSVTFTATINPGIRFLGWYSDESCTQLVSNQLSYTAIVNSNLTLYAKGEKIVYNINVGTAKHCSATVSKSTAYYGDTVTFNCTVDEGYEFKGWYSDEGLTQLVSGEANYSHQVVNSIILYPKIELITYTIRIGNDKDTANGMILILKGIVFYYDQLTKDEINYLRTGEYDKIDQSKIIETKSVNSTYAKEDVYITLNCPINAWIAVYSQPWQITLLGKSVWVYYYFTDQNEADITAWPYYWYKPTENATFHLKDFLEENSCICTAIGKEGIKRAYATSPVCQGKQAIFEADVKSSYEFSGWYSDEACTTLVSSNNPARFTAPTKNDTQTLLTYYAKANYTGTPPLSFKSNGIWKNVVSVFKKTNGAWVQQSDPTSLFNGSPSGIESNYIYLGE